jgi:hypothetical protein
MWGNDLIIRILVLLSRKVPTFIPHPFRKISQCDTRIRYCMIDDMIVINCNWVSTRGQWSVNLYTNWKQTTIHMRRYNIENSTKKYDTQHGNNIQNTKTNIKRIIKTWNEQLEHNKEQKTKQITMTEHIIRKLTYKERNYKSIIMNLLHQIS